jgi:hypothetical protein
LETTIDNLFYTGETITLNLRNMHYQVCLYREEVHILKGKYPAEASSDKMKHYKKIFKFYDKHLIPALRESAAMEQKHIAVIKKNPDPEFKPLVEEAQYHQELSKKFRTRFQEMHREFHTYSQSLRK